MTARKDEIEEKIKCYVERIIKTADADGTLIPMYEEEIKNLVQEKKQIGQQLFPNPYTEQNFGTALEKVFGVIKNPISMWKSDEYNDKRTILFMYFEDKLRYDYYSGFGTATLAYPLELITKNPDLSRGSVEMSGSDPESKKFH